MEGERFSPDHRIFLKAEEQGVESIDALVEPAEVRAGCLQQRYPHEGVDRSEEPELDLVKVQRLEEELHGIRVGRLDVGRVLVEGVGEHHEALGIRRLEDEHATRPKLPVAEVDQLDDPQRVEVLDDLRGEDTAERVIGKRAEVGKGVIRADVQSLFPAKKDHVEVEIYAAGPDAILSHQLEELSSATTDVDDIVPPLEVRDVDPLALLDLLLAPAEPLFKARIVELGLVFGNRKRHARRLAGR